MLKIRNEKIKTNKKKSHMQNVKNINKHWKIAQTKHNNISKERKKKGKL